MILISKNTKIFVAASLMIIAFLFPLLANDTWVSVSTTFVIFSIVALAQDVVLGRAGLYAMGQALFFGLGAYVFAILISHFAMNIILATLLAGLIPFMVAYIIGKPIIHLRGDYFLVVTLGLNIIFTQIINNDPFGLTGGPNGIFSITIDSLLHIDFEDPTTIYYIALCFLILTLLLLNNINYSKLGRAFYFINHDELAAKSVGINPAKLKLFAFAFGALLTGFAGMLYVLQYKAVSPEGFGVEQSILLFAVVIVGGQGSTIGVLIGAFVMFVLPEMFRGFAEIRYLIFGITMVVLMIARPHGIWPSKFGFYSKKFKFK